MDDPTLAGLEHRNYIEANAIAASLVPGSLVRRVGGVATILTGLPIRIFNQIIVEADEATDDTIAAAVATARARGDTFVVSLRKGIDDRRREPLAGLGLVRHAVDPWMPGMALHPIPTTATQAPGSTPPAGTFEIRLVTDPAGLDEHLAVAAEGFGMPVDLLRPVIGPALLERADCRVYVGDLDGRPVVCGLGVRIDRTIGVYNIATVPSARRRGFGAAMTARIATDGATDGCDVAILQASPMGRPIYERLGYRTVVEYEAWIEPPTAG